MNSFLNYLVEANLGICLFLALYISLLSRETDFQFKRLTLLVGLLLSLVFPMIHLQFTTPLVPAVSDFVPTYWLPEVIVGRQEQPFNPVVTPWFYLGLCYGAGVVIFLIVFLIRLFSMGKLIQRSDSYRDGKFIIAESDASLPTFSFFHFIFIGRKEQVDEHEKQQIIEHEKVHGRYYHSLDILLINILQIFFWFNPLLGVYRKIFIQLHEFEADARAVENRNVNDYCSLLARVALLSADFKLANHFNNSLTLKRITMMKTIKRKIRPWKIIAFFALLPVIFVAIACQDQVASDIEKISRNSVATTSAPEPIQRRLEQLQAENPQTKYILLQLNEDAMTTLNDLEAKYGLPKSMELFKGDAEPIKGTSEAGVKLEVNEPDASSYAILSYDELKDHSNFVNADGQVFTVVEHMPAFKGGNEALGIYLSENIKYPEKAAAAGVGGTVFTGFIVNPDGKISDAYIVKGVNPELDEEAIRVVEAMPAWEPGTQNGKAVKVKFVVPIKFAI